jgi:hypothetical protein
VISPYSLNTDSGAINPRTWRVASDSQSNWTKMLRIVLVMLVMANPEYCRV